MIFRYLMFSEIGQATLIEYLIKFGIILSPKAENQRPETPNFLEENRMREYLVRSNAYMLQQSCYQRF